MYKLLQHLGGSLMLPVAVLPAAVCRHRSCFRCFKYTSSSCTLFTSVGTTILEQLGILFAIGVAIGMAKKNDGAVALAQR